MSYTFVDLFSGAGGLSCGLAQAGFRPLAAFDNWRPALGVYNKNLGAHAAYADLGDTRSIIERIKPLAPDVIAGCPPCQDFSAAGRRVEAERAACMIALAVIAASLRRPWVLIENVEGTARSQAFAMALYILAKASYGISYVILDASLCGVPQRRKRLICICRLGAPHHLLVERLVTSGADRPRTLKDHFGSSLGFQYYYHHPRFTDRRGIYSVDEPAPTIRGTHREPPPGYRCRPNDAAPVHQVRALTQQERSLVQTFPPDWIWEGTKTDVDRMIGNAVPPALATYVGRAMLDVERGTARSVRLAGVDKVIAPRRSVELEKISSWRRMSSARGRR
jgi:DNA (cytosine-5)-methyltransferase 1